MGNAFRAFRTAGSMRLSVNDILSAERNRGRALPGLH